MLRLLRRCPQAALLSLFAVTAIYSPNVVNTPVVAQEQQDDPQQLMSDFLHYVQIARFDLAQNAVQQLLSQVEEDTKLLDLLENPVGKTRTEVTRLIGIAQKVDSLQEFVNTFLKRVEDARLGRARNIQNIRRWILDLGKGQRQRRNAMQRLKQAGQYAIPELLRFLEDDEYRSLHLYIPPTMVFIGEPSVYPLATALSGLDARPKTQVIGVLTELKFPLSIPYLKELMESPKTNERIKQILRASLVQLMRGTGFTTDTPSSEIYLALAQKHYRDGTDNILMSGYDDFEKVGLLWYYAKNIGLVNQKVAKEVYSESRCREIAIKSLQLDNSLKPAHSLWIASALRAENRLPEGKEDLTMPPQSATYHARLAGPPRLHDVLKLSLRDADTDLARDVMAVLAETAGPKALINESGVYQPLIEALDYPDRRIRFEAAFVLAEANPRAPYPKSFRVVPVLDEAIRQSGEKYAVVLGRDDDSRNRLIAAAREIGYKPIAAANLGDASEGISVSPGIDVIITDLPYEGVEATIRQSAQLYMLSATPIVCLLNAGEADKLKEAFPDERRVSAIQAIIGKDNEKLKKAIESTTERYAGKIIEGDEATDYALMALDTLARLAITKQQIYKVGESEGTLILALNDPREDVIVSSANVLSFLDTDESQQSIVNAALSPNKSLEVRIELFALAANSVKTFGNRMTQDQVTQVDTLTRTVGDEVDPDIQEAAAILAGALRAEEGDASNQPAIDTLLKSASSANRQN